MTQSPPASFQTPRIGYIIGGGLKENLRARLTVPANEVQEGSFVVIEDGDWSFNGLIIDLQLGSTDPRFADEQSEERLPADLARLLHGQTLYINAVILPQLMTRQPPPPDDPNFAAFYEKDPQERPDRNIAIKTVPAHHTPVRIAGQADIDNIFGELTEKDRFFIGYTREQGHKVRLDLENLVKRSSGIFGATGTGKSFLTRIILAGLIQANVAGALIFDMHNDYGPPTRDSDRNRTIPGLKEKFSGRVRLVGLGAGSRPGAVRADFDLMINENDIEIEDVEMLTRELNLKETTPTTLAALERDFGRSWYAAFKEMISGKTEEDEHGKRIPSADSVAGWALQANVNVMAAEGLHSKLGRLFNKPYITSRDPHNVVQEIIKALESGQHVVLSFGDFSSDLDYLLVTNILTRKIRETWVEKTEKYHQAGAGGTPPRPLTIVVEEAHKLLNREMAAQTAFSTIAREMRKYYVTLLIVDQRPSQIDDEVMSQLGTRISGWLGDDADISAVLSGLAARDELRGMLSRLQPKEEVLLVGWGLPMPLPVRSRRYDDQFWQELLGRHAEVETEAELLAKLGVRGA